MKIDNNKNEKASVILDFGGDEWDALKRLETILCTTPWHKHLNVYDPFPSETKLLIKLLRERAIIIGEVYYTPQEELTEETIKKANKYLLYLHKRQVDHNLFNVVNFFSEYEIDISLTDRLALFFPHIQAYVRCGDLEPAKLFELLQKDCCKRVIIFNGAQPDDGNPQEVCYSVEMQAPKTYILEKLAELQDEKNEALYNAMIKIHNAQNIPDVKFPPIEE